VGTHRHRAALAVALSFVAACGVATGAPRPAVPAAPDSVAIRADVRYLASPRLEGRLTGTPGNDSAAAYIARRYARLGLAPMSSGFLQHFIAVPPTRQARPDSLATQNVVALLRGGDPALRREYVVIGAHFDHLGRSTTGALDPEARDAVRLGADDNASGTAAVLELARIFAKSPPRRSLLFVNFSGEEQGTLGSSYFVDHMPVPIDSVDAMLNFDMVGRLRADRLIVYGVATAKELLEILERANAATRLAIAAQGDGFGPSDHSSFYARGIPVLHFFTDLHDDYHRATDVAEKVDAGGEARVVALAERVAREIADRPSRLTYLRTVQPAPMAPREGSEVYLGTIPDMAGGDTPGLRLSGVRAGSPADAAGLKAGDVIVEFGGRPVKDLYEYSDALYSRKPGDVISVVVLRGGQRLTLQVTLGKRG
jgi:hypothetical protein